MLYNWYKWILQYWTNFIFKITDKLSLPNMAASSGLSGKIFAF